MTKPSFCDILMEKGGEDMEKQLELRPGVILTQNERFFPLGEDTMVLSAFAAPKKNARGLDLCAGQGFLGILVGLRRPDVTLEGLELQEEACAIASHNAKRAGLDIPMTCADLRQPLPTMHDRFDFVLCNPPYFEEGRGKTAQGAMGQARSDLGASIHEVCHAAFRVLKTGGRLYLCFPASRLADLCGALEQNQLALKRLRFVHPRPGKEGNLALIDAVKQGGPGVSVLPPLFLRDEQNQTTEEYREIYEVRV